jgi:hypothetical protein
MIYVHKITIKPNIDGKYTQKHINAVVCAVKKEKKEALCAQGIIAYT